MFECNGGYELLDKIDPNDPASVTVNCTDLGFWDVEKPPRCVPVKCEPTVEDMTKVMAGFINEFSNQWISVPMITQQTCGTD